MNEQKPVQKKNSKLVALLMFVFGIVIFWMILNWKTVSRQVTLLLKSGAVTSDQSEVITEMKSRYPEYSVDKEPLVLLGSVGDLSETYSTDLFSISYPQDTYAYNANTAELSGFGFCPGGQQDCQYPKMVVIPMKTTTLMEWLQQDAGYHEKAYWNYSTVQDQYLVVVRPLQLNEYPGVYLEVTCKSGEDCTSEDVALGAFVANGRTYIFQYGLGGDEKYRQILQSFSLQ
ncbi:MAG: hypothetical protein GW762_03900 [Candidatus Pacebacteria bacterium]|nr:hypothetical protein [Candidatus Paceibacterota bacterium]PIR63638.1 MAG: hypothetical protein COU64_03515 [Candidatus Pacebacteria bacterium CG10_big_fil_rev_8_21_14_0_10_40_26]PIZ78740.1 MAG: hypothetical protein COY01_03885 [Candidatus Pacebacteria bacterium CG_4_10_14_0_2_um_filter_40_20]PJA68408.1 MAG: hypothetical protein CO156_05430 [Candidatus Pacebacteria bacterium CG_4_9_14_3_um_filter_40_12]PJC41270.1 MAG: hypothetical protein CO041_05500 [Candidatus Pacebacteria bacterium CG_4_9_